MAKSNGINWLKWIVGFILLALLGLSAAVLKLPIKHDREIGVNEANIKANTTNVKENKTEIGILKKESRELRDGVSELKSGQEVLIEKFNLEKEYRDKLDKNRRVHDEDSS